MHGLTISALSLVRSMMKQCNWRRNHVGPSGPSRRSGLGPGPRATWLRLDKFDGSHPSHNRRFMAMLASGDRQELLDRETMRLQLLAGRLAGARTQLEPLDGVFTVHCSCSCSFFSGFKLFPQRRVSGLHWHPLSSSRSLLKRFFFLRL